MNMFARFDENPAMNLQDIKETKRYGWRHGRTDGRTDNVKTVYPLQTKFAGGIIMAHTNIKECITEKQFSKFSTVAYVVGTQKNSLNETVLLSTKNIW